MLVYQRVIEYAYELNGIDLIRTYGHDAPWSRLDKFV